MGMQSEQLVQLLTHSQFLINVGRAHRLGENRQITLVVRRNEKAPLSDFCILEKASISFFFFFLFLATIVATLRIVPDRTCCAGKAPGKFLKYWEEETRSRDNCSDRMLSERPSLVNIAH